MARESALRNQCSAADALGGRGPQEWLKRIPPLDELEGKPTQEKLHEPELVEQMVSAIKKAKGE